MTLIEMEKISDFYLMDLADMLDEKAEQEKAKEEKEIINKYLNDSEDDDNDNYDSYSNDYWKKR